MPGGHRGPGIERRLTRVIGREIADATGIALEIKSEIAR
jgi:hypothetical protein